MTLDLPPAGGRATEAGMSFQAGVAAWFAAHLVALAPVGQRFGLGLGAFPVRLQLETGRFLDDIEVDLSDGSKVLVQCKTKPFLSPSPTSSLASTIAQLVDFLFSATTAGVAPDPLNVAAVLAVAQDASGQLDHLESACRYLDTGATWHEALGGINQDRRNALAIFADHARREWATRTSTDIGDDTLVLLARLFHVVRFSVNGGADDVAAARVVGTAILGDENQGLAILPTLTGLVRRLMSSGAPATRDGIVQQLRRAGVEDTRNPAFDHDFAALVRHTDRELQQLAKHTLLPFKPEGIPIRRECQEALAEAVTGGSLLVIGEPGAGKTGVLVDMARRLKADGTPCVFLSIDRFEGVASSAAIDKVINLQNPLEEVLAAWPGSGQAVLIVDALDASRGGPAEGVFATLISDLLVRLGERWSIVASIRTFDLKNGARFRRIMTGVPPNPANADPELDDVRHFVIPRLSPGERRGIGASHATFLEQIESAPQQVQDLLANVFNLSLAADLIQNDAFRDLGRITTQSDLIDLYQDLRLPDQDLILAVADTIGVMVERRNLTVPRTTLKHAAVQRVLKSGVLVLAGDRIAFAHHVLFDHATGRYYLEHHDPVLLEEQLSSDRTLGFLLGPAFRFAMERMWGSDVSGRPVTWGFVSSIASKEEVDPILSSIALRSAAERIEGPADIDGLCRLIEMSSDLAASGRALSRIARFGRIATGATRILAAARSEAWASVASACIAKSSLDYADAARTIMLLLHEKADLTAPSTLSAAGVAARAFLQYAWDTGKANSGLTTIAIRCVCSTFASSPAASRSLLQRILEEPHFTEHAHEEAPWLAEGVASIAPLDPEFALRIYRVLFGREAPQQGQNWFAGKASQIMPLLGTKEQDYEHARWHLNRVFPAFVKAAPREATKAVSAFVLGTMTKEGRTAAVDNGSGVLIVEDYKSLQDWRQRRRGTSEDGVLAGFSSYLLNCTAKDFASCVAAAVEEEAASSVWARLFGIGSDRIDVAGDLLWPFASDLELLSIAGLSRDALMFLTSAFPTRTQTDRRAFEEALTKSVDEDPNWEGAAARFLSDLDPESLMTTRAIALRQRLLEQGELRGNAAYSDFSIRSETVDTDFLLSRSGINISEGSDGQLRDLVRPLEILLKDSRDGIDGSGVAALWRGTEAVVEAIDRLKVATDTDRAAWAAVGESVERIAGSSDFEPTHAGQPSLARILEIIDRLAASPYPAPKEQDNSNMMGWGNWDIRIYAASANMDIARRFGKTEPGAVARLERYLVDPVATVRLQVAQSLNALWSVDQNEMWRLAERVASHEQHVGVLAFFVSGPLYHIFDVDPGKCDDMVRSILADRDRSESTESDRSDRSFHEAMGHLAAQQWIGRGFQGARAWIDRWTEDLVAGENYLWHLVSSLRFPLFARYAEPGPENDDMQARAMALVEEIAERAEQIKTAAAADLAGSGDEARVLELQTMHRAADNLLDHIGAQLYFGSGAYEGKGPELNGLKDAASKTKFLADYRGLLQIIGRSGSPRTLHQLIELYEYLVEGDAEHVFDDVAGVLLGQGNKEQYQHESLASDGLVRLVRLYLADHRSVFDDASRRSRLVTILELFSSAGWPDALNLLYELPDLLR